MRGSPVKARGVLGANGFFHRGQRWRAGVDEGIVIGVGWRDQLWAVTQIACQQAYALGRDAIAAVLRMPYLHRDFDVLHTLGR